MSDADRIKWDARYRERTGPLRPPDPWLTELELPAGGRALDLAGGDGRHALYLARRGLEVTLCDVSPVALERAAEQAAAAGLPLRTVAVDLEREPLPIGPWDLIVVFHYLQRSLFATVPQALAPGGLLVFCQPTRANLERHPHPSARFLLEDGELPGLLTGLEVLRYEEGWLGDDPRHEARLVARRVT